MANNSFSKAGLALVLCLLALVVIYWSVKMTDNGPANHVEMPSIPIQRSNINKALAQIALTPAIPARSIAISRIGVAIEKIGTPEQKARLTQLQASTPVVTSTSSVQDMTKMNLRDLKPVASNSTNPVTAPDAKKP